MRLVQLVVRLLVLQLHLGEILVRVTGNAHNLANLAAHIGEQRLQSGLIGRGCRAGWRCQSRRLHILELMESGRVLQDDAFLTDQNAAGATAELEQLLLVARTKELPLLLLLLLLLWVQGAVE